MARETERKFLVTSDGWKAQVEGRQEIRQAYLALDDAREIRIRIVDGAKASLTIKTGGPALSRAEFEYDVPIEDAEALIERCIGRPIAKMRHRVPAGKGLIWEIDRFKDEHEGLVLAEIELDQETDDIPKPDWLGREVTGDRAYYNATLAARRAPVNRSGTGTLR